MSEPKGIGRISINDMKFTTHHSESTTRLTSFHPPYTGCDAQLRNSFGVVIAECIDDATAEELAMVLNYAHQQAAKGSEP